MPASIEVRIEIQDDEAAISEGLSSRLGDLARNALTAVGVAGPAELNVTFVTTTEIAELNEQHMGVSGPTDVLSFPIDGAEPSDTDAPALVGDVVIAAAVAAKNAPAHSGTFDDEVALLVVHSCLHLVGHDHGDNDEREIMWRLERDLMGSYWTELERDPWA